MDPQLLLKAADYGFLGALRAAIANTATKSENRTNDDDDEKVNDKKNNNNNIVNYQHPHDSRSGYNKGVNILMLAARSGHLPLVDFLISETQINIAAEDAEIWNALHYACFSGHDKVAKKIFETKKIDPSIITMFEKATPQGFAEHRKFKNTVKVLSDKNVENNKLFEWTASERESNLKRCIQKLEKNLPRKSNKNEVQNDVTFLFRYRVSPQDFDQLRKFLQLSIHVDDAPEKNGKPFVVLDGIDILMNRQKEFDVLMEMEKFIIGDSKNDEKTCSPNDDVGLLFQVLNQHDQHETQKNDFLNVKLIIHTDFEAHQKMASAFFDGGKNQNNTNNTINGWRLLRSSSINGLEHVLVVTKVY